jgi:hypothetical protein
MTKLTLPLKLAALTLATISSITAGNPVKASMFDETAVEQNQFVAISQPYGDNKYNLLVIEQIPNKQACWSETGDNPVSVDILLLNFDFTGHCRRSTDANGYSIRFNGEDLGLDYLLSIVERHGEIQLIGINRTNRSQPEILVGTSKGMMGGPMKIKLNPGWRFSKRTYQGKALGHVYFSYTDQQAAMDAPKMSSSPNENSNDVTNLDSTPEGGTVQDFVAPETDFREDIPNTEQIINKVTPPNQESLEIINKSDQLKINNYTLTKNRFQ